MRKLLLRAPARGAGLTAALLAAGLAIGAGTAGATVYEYCATIDGLQETPPVATPASGTGTFTIDTDANTLSYNITYSGLIGTETAAHIHGYCGPGVPCGVVHPLPAGNPKVGVWDYPEANEADILAGLTYVNIHTDFRPGGEIRGQILECPVTPTDEASWGRVKTLFR